MRTGIINTEPRVDAKGTAKTTIISGAALVTGAAMAVVARVDATITSVARVVIVGATIVLP